jgi:hypothetical protein
MRAHKPTSHARARVAAVMALLAWLGACATDNGDPLFGTAFGPPGTDGGSADDGASPPPPPPDASPQDGAASTDAASDGSAACSSRVAVIAGGAASLTGAAWTKAGGWSGQALAGGASMSVPAIVPFGSGFLALSHGPADALQSVSLDAAWSAVAAVGAATTRGAPSLAVAGAVASGVYQGADFKMYDARRSAAVWTPTAGPIGTPQSFGPMAPAAAAAGADVVMAFVGDAGGGTPPVYTHVFSAGAWGPATAVAGSAAYTGASPALASVPSGAVDLVLVYIDDATRRVTFSARASAGKTWSAPAPVHTLATSDEGVSVVALSPTSLVVTFRGQDDRPYVSRGTVAGSAVSWTAATALVADASVKIASHPGVARGVCGDDAIAVVASAGAVRATRLRGGAWSALEAVTGAAGTYAAIATR